MSNTNASCRCNAIRMRLRCYVRTYGLTKNYSPTVTILRIRNARAHVHRIRRPHPLAPRSLRSPAPGTRA